MEAVFWIILLNFVMYGAEHLGRVEEIRTLYLIHDRPAWYQFVTSAFCHYNWNHLCNNLFFLYIFGKLVEEEVGGFYLWYYYILTAVGSNLVSWSLLPSSGSSAGASGAVFGLFAISFSVKLALSDTCPDNKEVDWRRFLEIIILGHFVLQKMMEAFHGSNAMVNANGVIDPALVRWVNHIAHLAGAVVGMSLVIIPHDIRRRLSVNNCLRP